MGGEQIDGQLPAGHLHGAAAVAALHLGEALTPHRRQGAEPGGLAFPAVAAGGAAQAHVADLQRVEPRCQVLVHPQGEAIGLHQAQVAAAAAMGGGAGVE